MAFSSPRAGKWTLFLPLNNKFIHSALKYKYSIYAENVFKNLSWYRFIFQMKTFKVSTIVQTCIIYQYFSNICCEIFYLNARLSKERTTFNVSNHIGQQTVDFISLLLYFEMGILGHFTDMHILGYSYRIRIIY